MKRRFRVYSRVTDQPRTNALCFVTRIPFSNGSYSKKVDQFHFIVIFPRLMRAIGVDVQAELRMKTEGSHILSHPASASANVQPSAVQKAFTNRHNQVRRTASGSTAKPLRPQQLSNLQTPRSQSMSSSAISPIAAKSPHAVAKGIVPDNKDPPRSQPLIQPRTQPSKAVQHPSIARSGAPLQVMTPSTDGSRGSDVSSNPGARANYYPPGYQAHLDQLGESEADPLESTSQDSLRTEQEYDAHADMLEDENASETSNGPAVSGPDSYPQNYPQQNLPPGNAAPMRMQVQPQMHSYPGVHQAATSQPGGQPVDPNNPNNSMYGTMNLGFDPYDPSLDADPFGLTASMHFPTQFTYHERR